MLFVITWPSYAISQRSHILRICGTMLWILDTSTFVLKFKAKTNRIEDVKKKRGMGMTAEELQDAGNTVEEIRAGGYRGKELQDLLTFKKRGYTAKALKDLGYTDEKLKVQGYTDKELKDCKGCSFEFKQERYAVLENKTHVRVPVVRTGDPSLEARVAYETLEVTAKEGTDFERKSGTLVFSPGEIEKVVEIRMINDNAYEDDEHFHIVLYAEGSSGRDFIGKCWKCTITIIDDDLPGKLRFEREAVTVHKSSWDLQIELLVERFDGGSGVVGCKYKTDNLDAVAGTDYDHTEGHLTFEDGQMSARFEIRVMRSSVAPGAACFNVILTEPSSISRAATFARGEESQICNVSIESSGKSLVQDHKDAGYRAKELVDLGYDFDELAEAGYNDYELQTAGFQVKELV